MAVIIKEHVDQTDGEIRLQVICPECSRHIIIGEEDTFCPLCYREIEQTNILAWEEFAENM